jgi:hypothetical protein
MESLGAIILGIFLIWSGLFQTWKALRDNAFYGKARIEFHETRGSFFFWLNLLLRVALIPGGLGLMWFGTVGIPT